MTITSIDKSTFFKDLLTLEDAGLKTRLCALDNTVEPHKKFFTLANIKQYEDVVVFSSGLAITGFDVMGWIHGDELESKNRYWRVELEYKDGKGEEHGLGASVPFEKGEIRARIIFMLSAVEHLQKGAKQ